MSYNENILVVPRNELVAKNLIASTPGVLAITADMGEQIEELVQNSGQFLLRSQMELDPHYKQIIPYMVFIHSRRIFVMQRSNEAGEQRLANKYTIGIGGHVRAGDLRTGGLAAWGEREFAEEIAYDGEFTSITLCGLVNDDRDLVGQVHLGVVFVLQATSDTIAVRSELKSGFLMDRIECLKVYDRMETWSAFVIDALITADLI